jgi:hypothetical protein
VLQIDQTQITLPRQGVAHWSFSLKDSCVHASTEKCENTKLKADLEDIVETGTINMSLAKIDKTRYVLL